MRYLAISLISLLFVAAAPPAADPEVELHMEKVTATFSKRGIVLVEQANGKLKMYRPHEHVEYDKEVDERDLEITEFHIKDKKVILLVFRKKAE